MTNSSTTAASSSSIMNHDNNSTATNTGAVALLEKYALLNSSIESTREVQSQHRKRIVELTEQLDANRLVRVQMEQERDEAQKCIQTTLTNQIRQASRRLEDVQKAQSEVKRLLDKHYKLVLEKAQSQLDQAREDFVQSSRQFRTRCKRMKLRLMRHDLSPQHFIHESHHDKSDSIIQNDSHDNLNGRFLSNSNNTTISNSNPIHLRQLLLMSSNLRDDKHSTNDDEKDDSYDLELEQVKLEEQRCLKHRDEAQALLEQTRAEHVQALEQASLRSQSLQRGRAQLQRLRLDCTKIETDMERLQRETDEARAMMQAFVSHASNKKAQERQYKSSVSSFASSVVHPPSSNQKQRASSNNRVNPYATSTSATTFTPPYNRQNNVLAVTRSQEKGKFGRMIANTGSRQFHNPYLNSNSNTTSSVRMLSGNCTMSYNNNTSSTGNGHGHKRKIIQDQPQLINNYPNDNNNSPVLIRDDDEEEEFHYNKVHDEKMMSRPTSSRRQHPHRAGRVRSNRQFSTSLQISIGDNEENNNGTSTSTYSIDHPLASLRKNNNNGNGNAKDDIIESDDDDDILTYDPFGH